MASASIAVNMFGSLLFYFCMRIIFMISIASLNFPLSRKGRRRSSCTERLIIFRKKMNVIN